MKKKAIITEYLPLLLIALAVLTIAGFTSCKQNTNPEITIVDLTESLTYLASDSLQGRLPGSEGGILAGNYIWRQRYPAVSQLQLFCAA